jgi:hypothetical protein
MGLRLLENNAVCTRVSGLTAYKNWDFGIFSYITSSIRIDNVSLLDNGAGLLLNNGHGQNTAYLTPATYRVTDSMIIGYTPNRDCAEARPPAPFPKSRVFGQVSSGIVGSTFAICTKHGPPYPWELLHCYPGVAGCVPVRRGGGTPGV